MHAKCARARCFMEKKPVQRVSKRNDGCAINLTNDRRRSFRVQHRHSVRSRPLQLTYDCCHSISMQAFSCSIVPCVLITSLPQVQTRTLPKIPPHRIHLMKSHTKPTTGEEGVGVCLQGRTTPWTRGAAGAPMMSAQARVISRTRACTGEWFASSFCA